MVSGQRIDSLLHVLRLRDPRQALALAGDPVTITAVEAPLEFGEHRSLGISLRQLAQDTEYLRRLSRTRESLQQERARTGASSPRPLYLTECLLIGPKENAA